MRWLDHFSRDLRYACRNLRNSPGFAVAAILTLALGIGANVAIFSVFEAVVLAPLPYYEPDKLVMVSLYNPTLQHATYLSYGDFQDWQRSARSLQSIAAFSEQDYDLTSPGTPAHVAGQKTSSGFFGTLGVKLALGRDFLREEDRPGGRPAAIISYRLWQSRFGASRAALGKPLSLTGTNYTIVGILPPEFGFGTEHADVYTALGRGNLVQIDDRTVHNIGSIGRLKSHLTIGQAQAEMNTVQQHIDQLYPATERGLETRVIPLKHALVGDVSGTLLLILGAVGVVLLIACANVANLFLARSTARTREFAIRLALGANRGHVFRQLITESVLVSLAGGVVGLAIAPWGLNPLQAALPGSLPRAETIGVNLAVLCFAFGLSMAVGIVFGLAPALKSSASDLETALKEGSRASTGAHHGTQSSLVILQIALTLVLLSGASLLFRTIQNLWDVNPGFSTAHILTLKVGLSPSASKTPSTRRIAYHTLTERVRQIPGVEAADITVLLPLNQRDNSGAFWPSSQQPPASVAAAPRALFYWVGPDYLRTMQIPLLRGRFLTPEDTANSQPVIVIDSVLARHFFPRQNPVGQTLTIPQWGKVRVVGVAGHVRHWSLDNSARYTQNQVYTSIYQLADGWLPAFQQDVTLTVRTPLDATTILPAIKAAARGATGDEPVYEVQTMRQIASASMSPQRFPMLLLSAFALLALLLASVGIYGVMSYLMTQRVREIGLRIALGAQKRDIFRMVIGHGLRLTLAGVVIGAAAFFVLARVLSNFSRLLYGVAVTDPVTFAAVSLVLTGTAVLACYLPARQAAQLDPMSSLRQG